MNAATHREFKDRLFEQFARIGKALASPKRLEIVDLLAQGERTVEEIARETAMSVASASQHLQALKTARMVEARREGLYMHYRLADEDVFRTWQAVRALAKSRLSEVDRVVEAYLEDRDALEAVDATELMERLSNGNVVVLDVRPEEEYRAGHIPGALSVPVDALVLQCHFDLGYGQMGSSPECLHYPRPEPFFAPLAVPTVDRAVGPKLFLW